MFRNIVGLAGGILLLCVSSVSAQDAILGQMYGAGAHAYFSGDYYRAYESFTAAIDAGSQDPRCYYYRGLTLLRLGREPEARQDFEKGAELETGDINNFYNVPYALQRVQGTERLLLEQYRTRARLAALERLQRQRAARYGELRQEEQRVLQQQAEAAASAPLEVSPPATGASDVFQSGPIEEPKPEEEVAEEAMEAPGEPAGDLFGAPAQGAPVADDVFSEPAGDLFSGDAKESAVEEETMPAADENPFGAAATMPADKGDLGFGEPAEEAEEAVAEEEAMPDDDPFGAAADDPFGAAEAAEEEAEEPAAADEVPAVEGPFGQMPAEGEEPAADEKAGVDSPFGQLPMAEPADGGNLFGGAAAAKDEPAADSPFGQLPPAGPAAAEAAEQAMPDEPLIEEPAEEDNSGGAAAVPANPFEQ